MPPPLIHPNWSRPAASAIDGFSIEVTGRETEALRAVAPRMPVGTPVAIPFLPGEPLEARVRAAETIRALGLEPMPHFSARRIASHAEFEDYLNAARTRAAIRRCFVVAGDPAIPAGPFADSMALIATGAFERAGIAAIGIGGHPEGHPNMTEAQCFAVLQGKCDEIERRGMAPLIVTQFGFDADAVLRWLGELRRRRIAAPVRLGVPGPAGIRTLMRYAALCGVGASAAVLRKYGLSLGNLIGSAGPDRFIAALAAGLTTDHEPVRLHFYPFGGVARTLDWIESYARTAGLDTHA
ncbi:MAG: methylenetetrahydrofolate reductase [Sphingomonas sp.]|uniref:methylenetetrahydrofolate reductase n=1 Tax=Sphingomonas sp. TaxID=28214 RepID=UPI00260EB879|nr:methylenetetrahydrofolate reductase [Sphingomonas sp.]MDK2766590.1 methylenetetrahydrofolate reductase [Sphingomonas sp.]